MNENKQTDSLHSAQRKKNHILLPSSRGKPAHESIQGEEAGIVWLPAKLACMSNAALLLAHYVVIFFFLQHSCVYWDLLFLLFWDEI